MSDELNIQDWLKLDWDKLCEIDAFREVVWKALGETEWRHDGPGPSEPPEVYAERLRDRAVRSKANPHAWGEDVYQMIATPDDLPITQASADHWYAYYATPIQRIIVCLLALKGDDEE